MMDESTLINKVVTFVMIAMLGWLGFTVQKMSVEQAVQGAQMLAIRESISVSQLDRYTRSEAVADLTILDNRIVRLEEWNQRLSDRLADVEGHLRDEGTE